ncbi:hypothetical protein [Holospora undulata]|nr:hypothetical protein [Holospora undulata]
MTQVLGAEFFRKRYKNYPTLSVCRCWIWKTHGGICENSIE